MNVNENRIREYAYQIWQSEGCPDGQAHRHWEMACKLAGADETADYTIHSQQKIPDAPQHTTTAPQHTTMAPQHTTIKNNDMDIVNKPQMAKAKALQKSLDAAKEDIKAASNENLLPSDTKSATPTVSKRLKQKRSEPTDATTMTSATSTGKSSGPKSARRKKAELVTDIVNTEMPKI